ncbi:hypothetical protein QQF64_014503 [Cirrhinus molitorella]|uniref:Uncharacterized protein n=1 Tax=Cirrhinus molitorella TaxID=172907 RepID=A0ABR3NSA1_9TELE
MSLCRMCGGPVDFPGAHKDCVMCLGRAHAEAALEGSDCTACEELARGWPLSATMACWALLLLRPPPSSQGPADCRMPLLKALLRD